MARHRYRAAVAFAVIAAIASPAAADVARDADARSNDSGVDWSITIDENGNPSVSAETHGGGGDECDWTSKEYPFEGNDPPARYGKPPTPEHRLYLVFCNGEYRGYEWIDPDDPTNPGIDPTALAESLVGHVPVELATIDVRPEGRAVTGIPSYFWIEGYDGRPITDEATLGTTTVAVEIGLDTVTWDFGDGTPPLTAGLGQAWPERSEIRHAYRDRGTYDVTVTIRLRPTFTVNGGAAQALEPITRTATLTYVVDEVQAVRDR